jgi:hypothetical protein
MTMTNEPLETAGSTAVTTTKPQAQTILTGTENRIFDFAEDAKVEIAKSMNGLVVSAHSWAANLDSVAGAPMGDLARQAADLLGSIQRGLEEKPVSELVADGEALIRRQPAIALGVAVAGGFLLARLVRSGSNS